MPVESMMAFLDGLLGGLLWCAVGLFAGWVMFRAPMGRRSFRTSLRIEAPVETVWSSYLLEPSPPGGWGGAVEIASQGLEGEPPTLHRAEIRHGGVGPFRESVWRIRSLTPHAHFAAEQQSFGGAALPAREAALSSLRFSPLCASAVLVEHEISRFVRGVFGFLYIPRAHRRALEHLRRHCEGAEGAAAAPLVGRFASLLLAVLAFVAMAALFCLGDASVWEVAAVVAFILQLALWTHEFGHLMAMRWFGHKDATLVMAPFLGGATIGGRNPKSRFEEAIIALMGPAFSGAVMLALTPLAPLGLKFFVLPMAQIDWTVWLGLAVVAFLAMSAPINLYNLAPISPLDGGRIVSALAPRRGQRLLLGAGIFAVLAYAIAGTGRLNDIGAAVAFVAVASASALLYGDRSTSELPPMRRSEFVVASLLFAVTLIIHVDASRVLLPTFLDAMRRGMSNDEISVVVSDGG